MSERAFPRTDSTTSQNQDVLETPDGKQEFKVSVCYARGYLFIYICFSILNLGLWD